MKNIIFSEISIKKIPKGKKYECSNIWKNRILREIPNDILKLTFLERFNLYNNNISLDEKILSCIIGPIVLMDTNLIGSITKKIPLNKCVVNFYQNDDLQFEYIIEVPDKIVDNKEIISYLTFYIIQH